MVETKSNMLPLGTKAPDFTLPNAVTSKQQSLVDFKSDVATVVMFLCNHCPYVLHIQEVLIDVVNRYRAKGIQFVAINANDTDKYPDDSVENMRRIAQEKQYPFDYLFDESQVIAKAYCAACTPDFYVFDPDFYCVYRGQFDDSRPGNTKSVNGCSLSDALDTMLQGAVPDPDQKPSVGCNIKWRNAVED